MVTHLPKFIDITVVFLHPVPGFTWYINVFLYDLQPPKGGSVFESPGSWLRLVMIGVFHFFTSDQAADTIAPPVVVASPRGFPDMPGPPCHR